MTSPEAPILFEERPTQSGHRIGVATLNAEKSLNALSLEMIELLAEQLPRWQADPGIVAVWLQGSGEKAFCAGGNIVRLYESIKESGRQRNPYAERFFTLEYQVDHLIHTFNKPLICWGHGIVMGGGLGLMSGARFRIVTEKSRIAMPEVAIGLYPDVGGSWFLNKMPGRVGLFLGLSGVSINAGDALFVGLADRFLPNELRATTLDEMVSLPWQGSGHADEALVDDWLRSKEETHREAIPLSPVRQHLDQINKLMDHGHATAAYSALATLETDDPWLQQAVKGVRKGSPASAVLIWEQLHRARHWSLAQTFREELVVSVNCCSHGEFAEGVRALLIEKDGNPAWQFASVEAVPAAWISEHFVSPWIAQTHPLQGLGESSGSSSPSIPLLRGERDF
ncbi:enoyl-CoA hydratase/isomerase family protein [Pokkaliibacter sp. MBI-7]|uniref:enoyl-CoA hydratase/isomerase family protein n=1 Tax=Pokkaliibacter sp. MBI-7 TaxID=3040600 RepID=UPI00244C78AD|nr:enoyl-CoA hydratase/isomerase family protein [Pokkaliibacter sp. MBI-7]MDH2431105.1 enoyl-CoA hydratase/isomerase family protein [Pokkaliibacter sp. MBI-7]